MSYKFQARIIQDCSGLFYFRLKRRIGFGLFVTPFFYTNQCIVSLCKGRCHQFYKNERKLFRWGHWLGNNQSKSFHDNSLIIHNHFVVFYHFFQSLIITLILKYGLKTDKPVYTVDLLLKNLVASRIKRFICPTRK